MVDLVEFKGEHENKTATTKLAVRKRYHGPQAYHKALKTYAALTSHLSLQRTKNYLLPTLIAQHDHTNSLFLEHWGDNMNEQLAKQELNPRDALGYLVQVLRLAAEYGTADIDLEPTFTFVNALVDDRVQTDANIPELGTITQGKVRFVDFDGWDVVETGSGGSKTINLASFVEGSGSGKSEKGRK